MSTTLDLQSYTLVWGGILLGMGFGWLGGSLSAGGRPWPSVAAAAFWIALAAGVRPLISALVVSP